MAPDSNATGLDKITDAGASMMRLMQDQATQWTAAAFSGNAMAMALPGIGADFWRQFGSAALSLQQGPRLDGEADVESAAGQASVGGLATSWAWPHLDTFFGIDRKVIAFMEASTVLASASAEFQAITNGAWWSAWQRYLASRGAERLAAHSASNVQSAKTQSATALMDSWLDFANESMLQQQRTPEFLNAQRRMLNALADFRLRQRELMELVMEQNHAPTRTEIDDLSKTVYELRRELRQVKRALAASQRSTPGQQPIRTAQ